MNIQFVIHEDFEAPGAFEAWRRSRGYEARYARVYAGEPLPETANDIDLLVVLGGPMSPTTTPLECPYFDAAGECALIAKCIQAGRAVVGVCLGAQLIGTTLGAAHERSPEKEIGTHPIRLTPLGRADARLSHFGDVLEVGHWHSDMPGLTPAAKVLAESEGCPRQIIQYDDLVYGFQCHMEFTREVVLGLIAASEDELRASADHTYVQPPHVLRAHDYDAMNAQLFLFLDRLMEAYTSSRAHLDRAT